LVIGISLGSVAIVRGSSTENWSFSFFKIPPNVWALTQNTFLFPSRDIQLTIDSNATIDVYLLDSAGITLWNEKAELQALASFNGVQQETIYIQSIGRGQYALLVYNPSNSSASAQANITFYGFEKDLLFTSMIVSATGLIATLVILFQQWQKRR
jgi:hypothetical protein